MQDSKRYTDVKNSLLDSVGEGEGGMICENSIETCILSYVKPITSQGSIHEHPVSCTEPGLAIYFTYDNIHVSVLFSQNIPPSPSPTEPKSLFFTSVSLLLSHIQGQCYLLSKFHIYALIYCIGVFLSDLLQYSILGCSFIHLIRTDSNAFFLIAE